MAVKMKLIFTLILEITLHRSLKKYTLGVLIFKIEKSPDGCTFPEMGMGGKGDEIACSLKTFS